MRSALIDALATLALLLSSCIAGGIVFFAGAVQAGDAQYVAWLEEHWPFNISPGPLSYALLEFSRQAKIQVIVSPNVPDVKVAGVRGNLTARDALGALLQATGLVYTVVGDTVTIHVRTRSANAAPPFQAQGPR